MNLTDWGQAQALAQRVVAEGEATAWHEPSAPVPRKDPISVDQAWDSFLAQARARKLSPATIYKHDLLRRQMLAFTERRGLRLLGEFNLDVLEAFQAEWSEGALASLKKLERLKAFFRAAFVRRWVDDNPAVHLRGPKVKARPTLPFNREEMANILTAVERYPDKTGKTGRANALRLRAFILLLRYSGLRIGDATSLAVDRLVGNKLFLRTAKTHQPVFCVVPEFVADALKNVPRLSDKYFFWTGRSRLHTAIGCWQRTLRKLFKLAGIERGHAHRFRDTFAVELLLAGVPTEEVAVLLGHSNIKITQEHYSPWVRSRQLQLEANLERAWNRDPLVLLHAKPSSKSLHPHSPPN